MKREILDSILKKLSGGRRCYWVLLDPDDFTVEKGAEVAAESQKCGADAILVGGSLLYSNHFDLFVSSLKKALPSGDSFSGGQLSCHLLLMRCCISLLFQDEIP